MGQQLANQLDSSEKGGLRRGTGRSEAMLCYSPCPLGRPLEHHAVRVRNRRCLKDRQSLAPIYEELVRAEPP